MARLFFIMKLRKFSSALLLVGVCAAASGAHSLPLFGTDDSWTDSTIEVVPPVSSLDEALLNLSRNAATNVFVNATHLPVDVTIQPYNGINGDLTPLTPALLLGSINLQSPIRYDRTELATVEVWPLRETESLARHIVESQNRVHAAATRVMAPVPQGETEREGPLFAALKSYLQAEHAWNSHALTTAEQTQAAQGLPRSFALADLPPGLRRALKIAIYNEVLYREMGLESRVFEDDFWQQAQVRLKLSVQSMKIINGKIQSRGEPLLAIDFDGRNPASLRVSGLPNVQLSDVPPEVLAGDAQKEHERKPTVENPDYKEVLGALDDSLDITAPAPQVDLDADPNLQQQVKFTVTRGELSAFVDELAQQSGVVITLAPDAPGADLLTARSAGMSLASVMRALTRLYGVRWSKNGDSYAMQPTALDPLQLEMMRQGNSVFFLVDALDEQRGTAGRLRCAGQRRLRCRWS